MQDETISAVEQINDYNSVGLNSEHEMETALTSLVITHTGQQFYLCRLCNKAFTTKETIEEHLKVHSERNRNRNVSCDESSHQCTKCDKIFKTKCRLRQHASTHTAQKNHQCSLCGKAF